MVTFPSFFANGSIVDFEPLTNGQLLIGSTGLTANPSTLSPGANAGVTIVNGAGSITLSTVQDIRSSASPTFASESLSGLTLGSVLFSGTGGLLSQNNSKLFWDNTNYRLGVGNSLPDSALTISNNVSTLPAAIAGAYTLLHLGSLDGVGNTILQDSFGQTSQHVMRRADGTAASPAAVQSGDQLGQFLFYGYGATAYQANGAAKITSNAVENFTDSTGAANLQFFTRPSGSIATSIARVTIDQNGNMGIGSTAPITTFQVGTPTGSIDTPVTAGFFTGSDSNQSIIIARNVTQPQEIQIGVNQAGLYSEIQATHATVAYDYLVLNRQGGNVGIANAAPSYTLDVNGPIRSTANLIDQGIATSSAGAPLSITSGQVITAGITNAAVTSTTATTSGTTAVVLLTTTPVAGTYLVTYSGNITASSAGGNVLTVSILVGGTQQTQSVRTAMPFSTSAFGTFQNMTIATNAIVTVNGSQAIAIQGQSSAGTVTTSQRELDIVRLQ
jgi:hypothetical protein